MNLVVSVKRELMAKEVTKKSFQKSQSKNNEIYL